MLYSIVYSIVLIMIFVSQGITPALSILKEGLISGTPDEKEEAARVLVELINLASTKTLSTGKIVMLIAGPLIRVLGDRYGWHVKVATLEALVQLVRKVQCIQYYHLCVMYVHVCIHYCLTRLLISFEAIELYNAKLVRN